MIQADPLQLECKGYGYPIPAVEWYTKGKLLVPDGVRITLKDTPAQQESSVMINGTIRITNMDFDDAGDYECVATNNLDNGVSNATISVKVKGQCPKLLNNFTATMSFMFNNRILIVSSFIGSTIFVRPQQVDILDKIINQIIMAKHVPRCELPVDWRFLANI